MIGIVYGYLVRHGGIGRYISEVLPHSSHKSEIEILTIENNLSLPNDVTVTKIDCKRDIRFLSTSENLDFSRKVADHAKSLRVLHSHGVYNLNPHIYTAHICLKRYFEILETHGRVDELPQQEERERIISLENEIAERSEVITAVSGKVANEISDSYGIDKRKIHVIKGASRMADDSDSEQRKDVLRIGFVGGNLKAKGLDTLVMASNLLSARGYNIEVTGAATNQQIEDYFLNEAQFNFELKGKIELGPGFYKELDVFVCPSLYEAYSLSTLEAMSLGVPVVSSNLNGVFYDNPSSVFARVNNITEVTELADTIEKVYNDTNFRRDIIDSGRKVASSSSWVEIAEAYDQIYSLI